MFFGGGGGGYPVPPPIERSAVDEEKDDDDDMIGIGNDPPKRIFYFGKAAMENTPSRKYGVDAEKELGYRQSAAGFIQEMGQQLKVNQLCINTAIVFMNRFYMFHPFTIFNYNGIAIAAIFLAAKTEEQPRKLVDVVKFSHSVQFRKEPMINIESEAFGNLVDDLITNEGVMLQTFGFDVNVDHPHTHIVKCCQLVQASKELSKAAYMLATNTLQLTTMCVQYRPTLVACLAIHVACKWSEWQIPRSKEGKDWWKYVDDQVTFFELEQLTHEYLEIYNKAPPNLKIKIANLSKGTGRGSTSTCGVSGGGNPPLRSATASSFTPMSSLSQPLPLTSSNRTGNVNSNNNRNIRSRSRSPSPKRQRITSPNYALGAPSSGIMMPQHPSKPHHQSSVGSSSVHPQHGHGMKPPAYRSPPYGGGPTHQQKQPSQQPPHLSIKQEPTKHHYSLQQQQHRKPGPPSPLHSSRTFYSKTYPYSNLNEHSTATSSGSKVLPSHSNQSHSNPTSGASFVQLPRKPTQPGPPSPSKSYGSRTFYSRTHPYSITQSTSSGSKVGPPSSHQSQHQNSRQNSGSGCPPAPTGVNYHNIVSSHHHTGASSVGEKSVSAEIGRHRQQHRPLNGDGGLAPSSSHSFKNVKSSIPQQSTNNINSLFQPDRPIPSASTKTSRISNPLPNTYQPKQLPPNPFPNLSKDFNPKYTFPNLSSSTSIPPKNYTIPKLPLIKQEPQSQPIQPKPDPFPNLKNINSNNTPLSMPLLTNKLDLESQTEFPPLLATAPIVKKDEGEEDKNKKKDKQKEHHREREHKKDKHNDKDSDTGGSRKKKYYKENSASVSVINHFDSDLSSSSTTIPARDNLKLRISIKKTEPDATGGSDNKNNKEISKFRS